MASLDFTADGSIARLVARGDWVVDSAGDLDRQLRDLKADTSRLKEISIRVEEAGRIDTAGAWLLLRTARGFEAAGIKPTFSGLDADRQTLFRAVAERTVEPVPVKPKTNPVTEALAETGHGARAVARDAVDIVAFVGQITRGLGRMIVEPRRIRWYTIVTHVERAGLMALPIVILISFLIGAIIAQQGAFQLRRFGAEVYVVNLVGILVLREVGLLLAAIMFAGRSGSAYTAEIGSMRMREEVDAMRVIGLDPTEVLVIPRLIALVIALPVVTMVSNLAALAGGLVTCWLYLGMEPGTYVEQLQEALSARHLWVGLIKAPFMAAIIGVIACLEGMKVQGSTESLGLHTTASVVKAIFMVIVVDGIFAIVFASIGM